MSGRNLVHCRLRVRRLGFACALSRPLGRSHAHHHPVCSLPHRSIGSFAYEFEVPYRIRSSHGHFGVFHFRYRRQDESSDAGKAKGPASLIWIAGPNAWEERMRLAISLRGEVPASNFHAAIRAQRQAARHGGLAARAPRGNRPRQARVAEHRPTSHGYLLTLRCLRHRHLCSVHVPRANTRAQTIASSPRAETA
jgi:hypothetical protein